jgi:hypothetical protein
MKIMYLKILTGLKSILITTVFSFCANTGFSQPIPEGNLYLGQIPPGNTPKIFPLFAKPGFFAAERIAISTELDSAHYFQVTGNGNHYISSKSGRGVGLSDWCSVIIKGYDTTVISLGRPLNTSGENLDFFISRDESFMIVTNRPGLAISYRNSGGSWTDPLNFGPNINFGLGSWGPWVTADNKYLFYSTGTKRDYSDVYVYWVLIDGIIDSIKETIVTEKISKKAF